MWPSYLNNHLLGKPMAYSSTVAQWMDPDSAWTVPFISGNKVREVSCVIVCSFVWESFFKIIAKMKQECIPVGCVPAARRPYAGVCFPGGSAWSRGGVSLVRGVSAWSLGGGGVSLVWGDLPGPGGGGCLPGLGGLPCSWGGLPGPWEVCLVPGGSAWSLGGLPGPRGVCLVPGGPPGPGGSGWSRAVWHPSMHWGRHPPPRGQTHTCKNITLATTSLRPVTTVCDTIETYKSLYTRLITNDSRIIRCDLLQFCIVQNLINAVSKLVFWNFLETYKIISYFMQLQCIVSFSRREQIFCLLLCYLPRQGMDL